VLPVRVIEAYEIENPVFNLSIRSLAVRLIGGMQNIQTLDRRPGGKTMAIINGMFQELEQEARTTRRVLERIRDDQLGWKPHAKARTLGELAMHVAIVPGALAQLISSPSPAQIGNFTDPVPKNTVELLTAHDESIAKAKQVLAGMDDDAVMATWRLMRGERELLAVPRIAMLRSVMLNHWYHHRGQLTVYLKELDVPIPSIYGPSADENPFA
jgi:uncharacterized damage-inducible protein DinB